MKGVRLTAREWKALREWFLAEKIVLVESYGVPGDRMGTYLLEYCRMNPSGAMLFVGALRVFESRCRGGSLTPRPKGHRGRRGVPVGSGARRDSRPAGAEGKAT